MSIDTYHDNPRREAHLLLQEAKNAIGLGKPELAIAKAQQAASVLTPLVARFEVGDEIKHRDSTPESSGDFVVDVKTESGAVVYTIRDSQVGDDFESDGKGWVKYDEWLPRDDRPRRHLTVTFDVTDLDESEIGALELEAVVQGESSDGHPDVEVESKLTPEPLTETVTREPRDVLKPGDDGSGIFYADDEGEWVVTDTATLSPQDAVDAPVLWRGKAADALGALDAYAEGEGFPPYSDLMSDPSLSREEREGWVGPVEADGRRWAIMTNFTVWAVPVGEGRSS